MAAYGVKGAAYIESGIRDLAQWSDHMVKEFGEQIRPHLDELWQKAQVHMGDSAATTADVPKIDNKLEIPYVNDINENQSRQPRGDAQAALRELTASAEHDAGGNAQADAGERIRAEAQSLVSWAKQRSWLVEPKRFRDLTQKFQDLEEMEMAGGAVPARSGPNRPKTIFAT
jgi:hypothetical protein